MLREGQWVKYEGLVGIWYKEAFHQVDSFGFTVRVIPVKPNLCYPVTQLHDIPLARRAHLPEGYNPALRRGR
jgi:hypothetical protein